MPFNDGFGQTRPTEKTVPTFCRLSETFLRNMLPAMRQRLELIRCNYDAHNPQADEVANAQLSMMVKDCFPAVGWATSEINAFVRELDRGQQTADWSKG
jgi:hypothetical protein